MNKTVLLPSIAVCALLFALSAQGADRLDLKRAALHEEVRPAAGQPVSSASPAAAQPVARSGEFSEPKFLLQGILRGADRALAVISGRYYREGQRLGSLEVIRIGDDYVVLRAEDQQEIMLLLSPQSKAASSAAQDGGL